MKNKVKTRTIGVTEADRGCGATHFSLALANCLSSRLRRKTALVEFEKDELRSALSNDFEYREGMYHFAYLGFEVFTPVNQQELEQILQLPFEEIVIDFGYNQSVSHAFAGCDHQFITGSLVPFRRQNFFRTLNALENFFVSSQKGKRTCLSLYGNINLYKRCERKFSVFFRKMPFIEDPEMLSHKEVSNLLNLLEE